MTALPIRYRVDGQPRLSVTQILSLSGQIDSAWFTPLAAERGSRVHRWCEQYDRGETPDELPSEWMGYCDAYIQFLHATKPVWATDGIEREVHHHGLQIAGRVDRIAASFFGLRAIVDLKTGGQSPWHARQLAAYSSMSGGGTRWAVYLSATGKYTLTRYSDVHDYREFLADVARVRGTVRANGDFWVPIAA